MRSSKLRWCIAGAVLSIFALVACSEKTPEEKLQAWRAQYTAELGSFTIEQEPVVVDEAVEVEETDGEGGDQEEVVAAGIAVVTTNVVLDILVSTKALDKLDGLTIDFSHVDGAKNEKDHRLLWIDTSQLERGPGAQITYVVEGVDYTEGDGFAVEVRVPVPTDQQSQYREFDQL